MKKYPLLLCLILLLSVKISWGQKVERPPIWGIAKMTILVSDYELARRYYGEFLGFDEAFSYDSKLGKIISFKVNDRQFLEFIEDRNAKKKDRLVSVSFETDNVKMMYQYLKSQGIKVPEKITIDGAANETFSVQDPSGNIIEFIDFASDGLHKKSHGLFLSEKRISKRIHHVGLYTDSIMDNDLFYEKILDCKQSVRYPENRDESPTLLYLNFNESPENIEHYWPNDRHIMHPCFLVDDMQETVYTLKERKKEEILGKPMIAKGKRWILNLYNSDNTRVEFTEAFCVR